MMHNDSDVRAIHDEVVKLIPALRRFSLRFCRNDTDVDDLVQETITRTLSALHQFQRGTSLKSWMFTIMRNTFNTRYVKEKRCIVGIEGLEPRMPKVSSPQEWAVRAKEVEAATFQLSRQSREIYQSIVFDGEAYETVAKRWEVPVGTIKSRVHRCRQFIAGRMGETVENAASV